MRLPLALIPVVVGLSLLAYSYADQLEQSFPVFGHWRPFLGFEHLLAAVGVGAWGAVLGNHATWGLLGAFGIGAVLGYSLAWNDPDGLPFVGLMLLLSIVCLALAVLLPVRMPVEKATVLVAVFGVYHGNAYGSHIAPTQDAARSVDAAIGLVTPWSSATSIVLAPPDGRSPFGFMSPT